MSCQFSFLIPTRNNLPGLAKLFQSVVETTADLAALEIVLVIDADDLESQAVTHDRITLKKVVVPKGCTMGELNNTCFEHSSGRYLMLMNDDVVLRTRNWDRACAAVFASFQDDIALIHVNDLLFRERLCTFPMLSRKACLAIGVCPKPYQRYRIDDHIYDTYNLLAHLGHARIVYLPEVIFEHENHVTDNAPTEGHVFASEDNKVYVPKAGIIEADAKYCDDHFEDRKQAALKLAGLIEAEQHTRALEQLRVAGSARLAAVSDSHSYRRPGYKRTQPTGVVRDSSNARTTVAVVTADLRSEVAQRCLAALKQHTANYDLVILDNNRGPDFSHSREMNKVLRAAQTEFVALLDDDVIVEAGWLDGLLRCMDDTTGVVVPMHKDAAGELSFTGVYLSGDGQGTHAHTVDRPAAPRPVQCYCSAALLIDMRKCGNILMDQAYSKYFFDLVHGFEVWEAGWRAVCTPEVTVTHIGGATVKWGSAEANALQEKDRATFVKSWIETGRLARIEADRWQSHPYLASLSELPRRIEAFADRAPKLPAKQFEAQLKTLLADTAPYALLGLKLRRVLGELLPSLHEDTDLQKLQLCLDADLSFGDTALETRFVVSLANKLFRAKKFKAAESMLLTALQRQPEQLEFWRPLGYVRFMAGDLSGARAAFDSALMHAPEDVESLASLGGVLFHLNRVAEAAESYEEAIRVCRRLSPTHPRLVELTEKLATTRRPAAVPAATAAPASKPVVVSPAVKPVAAPAAAAPSAPAGQRILFLPLEFSHWQHARHVAYPAQIGLEEGLHAQGADVLTLPSVFGWPAAARTAWLRELRRLCVGRAFDQVWVEIVHSEWSETDLEWLATLAPVRVGFVMESLQYDAAVGALNPVLAERETRVTQRLAHLTHVLAVDETDVADLNLCSGPRALWWPQAVPARFIGHLPAQPGDSRALFAGMVYGERQSLLEHPALKKLLRLQPSPEAATPLPRTFDELNGALSDLLLAGEPLPEGALVQHAGLLARLRAQSFGQWLQALQDGVAVANLPSFFQGFAGRVFEAMAAGRPVITWDLADRPRTRALFAAGTEILFYQKNSPDELAEHIRQLQREPALARRIAESAQHQLKRHHTVEIRVRQILDWVHSGAEPDFQNDQSASPAARFAPVPTPTVAHSERPGRKPLTVNSAAAIELALACGRTLVLLGDLAAAAAQWTAIAQRQPERVDVALALADVALRQSDLAACRTHLDAVLDHQPGQVDALVLLAELALRLGQSAGTKPLCRLLAQLAPNHPALADLKAATKDLAGVSQTGVADATLVQWLEARIKQVTQSARQREAAPATAGTPAITSVGELATACEHLRRDETVAAWNSAVAALTARPCHPEAWRLLAEIARTVGDPDRARTCAEHAVRLAPRWQPAQEILQTLKTSKSATSSAPSPLAAAAQPQPPAARLSVCVIAKNEEKFLARCLNSVRGLAHQLVVVDTGSTDRTVAIARECGAEVHPFAWNDDFSAARNAALVHATGDWVLILDADEELRAADHARLAEELQAASVMAYRLPLVDHGKEAEGCHYVPRLFRNAPGLAFTGRIHEQVFPSVEALRGPWGLENKLSQATLVHHGYTQELVRSRKKIERNLRLLELALAEQPADANLLMNHGLELVRSGRVAEGLEQYGAAFRRLSAQPAATVVPELRETLLTQLSSHLLGQKSFVRVVELLESPLARTGGLSASLHFTLALALLELKRFDSAAEHLRHCLAKRTQPALCPVNASILKGGPHHCLAMCLAALKQPAAAGEAFRAALAAEPASRAIRLDFARWEAAQGEAVPALQALHQLVGENVDDADAWIAGGEIALGRPEFLEFARDWTGEAVMHCPKHPVLARQRAETLLLSGAGAETLPLWRRFHSPNDPAQVAALLLAALLSGAVEDVPAPRDERAVSQEFLKWYRRLVQSEAGETVNRINERLTTLRAVLPTAAGALKQVLAAANEPVPA